VQPSETRRTFRELARPFFAGESPIEFEIKLLLLAIIAAISALRLLAHSPNSFTRRRRSDQFIVSLAPCYSWVYRNTARFGQPLQRSSPVWSTSLKRCPNESIPQTSELTATRESLDTERIAFTMSSLWEDTIERDAIAKLNENF